VIRFTFQANSTYLFSFIEKAIGKEFLKRNKSPGEFQFLMFLCLILLYNISMDLKPGFVDISLKFIYECSLYKRTSIDF